RPETLTVRVGRGETRRVELTVDHVVPMPKLGYRSGDPHVHIARAGDEDERAIFDLLDAEDIHDAAILAYNEPAGPYHGSMDRMDSPQLRGLGRRSILARGDTRIVSGQEYRSGTYGHMNL